MDERMDSAYLWLDEFGSDAVVPPELATPLQSSLNPGNGSCGLPLGSSQVPAIWSPSRLSWLMRKCERDETYRSKQSLDNQNCSFSLNAAPDSSSS